MSEAEEIALQSAMIDRAAAHAPRSIVFKPHPYAPPLRTDALLWYWLIPLAFGLPLLRLYLLTEHTGCSEDDDGLTNTRTTIFSPKAVATTVLSSASVASFLLIPPLPYIVSNVFEASRRLKR